MSEDSPRTTSVEGILGAWLIFELFPVGSLRKVLWPFRSVLCSSGTQTSWNPWQPQRSMGPDQTLRVTTAQSTALKQSPLKIKIKENHEWGERKGASKQSNLYLTGRSENMEGGPTDLPLCWIRTFMAFVFFPCRIWGKQLLPTNCQTQLLG